MKTAVHMATVMNPKSNGVPHITSRQSGLRKRKLLCYIFFAIFFSFLSFPALSFAETYVSGHITEDTTWTPAGSPYIVTGDVTVRHSDSGQLATLTIEPGVEVRFESGTGLYIGYRYGYQYFGALIAQGTEASPITFTSNAVTPAAGDWQGIYFQDETDDATTILEYCIVEYGGHTHNASIYCSNSFLVLNNNTIRHSSGDGIHLYNSNPSITNSIITNSIIEHSSECGIFMEGYCSPVIGDEGNGNVISNSGTYAIAVADTSSHPVVSYNTISDWSGNVMRLGPMMDAHDNIYSGAGTRAIEVLGGNIVNDTRWGGEIQLYIVTGDVKVNYPSHTAMLTIDPGVEVRFEAGTGLYIGNASHTYYGALVARGTETAPITFTSNAASPAPGDWRGLILYYTIDGATSVLEHCVIEYGGGSPYYANMYCSSSPILNNNTIRYSSGYGIYLYNSASAITNSTISYNVGDGVHFERCTSAITNSTISDSGACGISLAGSGALTIGGAGNGNEISNCGTYAIYEEDTGSHPVISHNSISNWNGNVMRLGAMMDVHDNIYSGPGTRAMEVLGETIKSDTLWRIDFSHYIVLGDVSVYHSTAGASNVATLTIEPGVEVRFEPGRGLSVGFRYGSYYGALVAQGTETAPITFTSNAASPAPGYWEGLIFNDATDDATTVLEHCVIEYGGERYQANIYCDSSSPVLNNNTIRYCSVDGIRLANSNPSITNSTIDQNGACGISMEASSAPVIGGEGNGNVISNSGTYAIGATGSDSRPVISHNTISDWNGNVMRLGGMMDVHDNIYSGAGSRAIEVLGGHIITDTRWHRELPYEVVGDVTVRHANYDGSVVTLTIEPGAEVRFGSGFGLYIGYGDWNSYFGALVAQGTESSPITFTSNAATAAPGDWQGIIFQYQTVGAATYLEHCIVEYGGHTNNSNIYCSSASPTLQYNKIRHSSQYGIYLTGTGCNNALIRCNNVEDNPYGIYTAGNAQPQIAGNNFLGNQNYGMYNAGTVTVTAQENWWGDVNGPGYNGDDVFGDVDFSSWLIEESTCINSPPTNLPPLEPRNPDPADGAVRVPLTDFATTLRWSGGDGNAWDTVTYDVFLGTDEANLVLVAEGIETAEYHATDLEEGTTYTWQIVSKDSRDETVTGPVWHFTTQGPPPDLIISDITWMPTSEIIADQVVTFTATVENIGGGPCVDPFQVGFRIDGIDIGSQEINAMIPVGESVQVNQTWTALAGDHTVEVTADSTTLVEESNEDNNSLSETLPHVIDPAPPVLVGTYPVDGAALQEILQIVITLQDQHGIVDDAAVSASIAVTKDSQPVTGTVSEADDVFTFIPATSPLADGSYRVSLTAQDIEGNAEEYSFSFTVDSQAPAAPAVTGGTVLSGLIQVRPVENRSNSSSVTLTGTREDDTALWINGEEKAAVGSGDWSVALSLPEGANALEILSRDRAGNMSPSVWVDILVDSVAPEVTAVTPGDQGFLNLAPATVIINFSEATSGVRLDRSIHSIKDAALVEIAGTWELSGGNMVIFTPQNGLHESVYQVEIQLEDELSNRGVAVMTHFTVDITPPEKPVIDPVTSPTHNPAQTITGAKEVYAALLLGGQEVVGHTAGTGWEHTVTLSNGENTLAFAARDRAGNMSEDAVVPIVYDNVPPLPVTTLASDGEGDGTTVALNWTGYDESLHGDIASYRVYVSAASFSDVSALTPVGTVNAGTFAYTVQNLTKATPYWFAVVAVDTMGNADPQVCPVSATPIDKQAPAEITNLAVECFDTSLVFTWEHSADAANDLEGYKVYFNGATEGEVLPKTQNALEKTGLTASTLYPIRISAFDADQNESAGLVMDAVTLLQNPLNLTVTPHSGYVDLAWDAAQPSQYVKLYRVYVSEADFGSVEGMTPKVTSTTTTAKVAGLQNETPYFFAVTTVNLSDGERKQVTTVSATPMPDTEGPEITNVKADDDPLTDGTTLTQSARVSLEAQDPAGVSRVEFFLNGVLFRTDYAPEYNGYIDIGPLADGSHTLTITAYDTFGNSTTQVYNLNVAMGLPGAPVITSPQHNAVTNKPLTTVTGTADKNADVVLLLDGVETGTPDPVSGLGTFSFQVTLAEGENHLQARTSNRTGSGPLSDEVLVTLDTSIPDPPMNLTAESRGGGAVKLTWQRPMETSVQGYNLYRAQASFSATGDAVKVNTEPIPGTSYADLPAAEGEWFYRVTTVDQASNESGLSVEVSAQSDNTPPRALSIQYAPEGKVDPQSGRMGPGTVNVTLTLSEPLASAPFLSLTPEGGTPMSVDLVRSTDTVYRGFFVITDTTPTGTAYAVFSARDVAGNRGTEVDEGDRILIDTDGPSILRLEIQPPEPVQNDEQNPVTVIVALGLDQPLKPGTTPELSYLLSGTGREAAVIGPFTRINPQTGEAEAWHAAFELPADAGLIDPETFHFIYRGLDDLDNEGLQIGCKNLFQVYQGGLPPLAAPEGLTGKALAGGKIGLAWNPVDEAAGYQVYRQAPGEGGLTELARVDGATAYEDQTQEEGTHLYAVATIREENDQESVSGMSNTVEVLSDSSLPNPPQNLTLDLVPQGIRLQWEPPVYTEPVTYAIYRSDQSEITSVEGLTPLVTGIEQTDVVDPTPSPTEHCYVITAVDEVGNESAPSNSAYLNVDLLPVATLEVAQQDHDPPVLTWSHADTSGKVAGYWLDIGPEGRRMRVNQALMTGTAFTDYGYARDERVYTVTTVDQNSIESLPRSLTLPVLEVRPVEGSKLSRGIMNRLEFKVENNGASAISNVRLKCEVGGKEHVSETFDLSPRPTTGEQALTFSLIPVTVGGYDTLDDPETLTATLEMTPNPGEKVRVIRTSEIEVADGTLVLQLGNETFTRGGTGKVWFALENTGEAEIEIVTARQGGKAPSDQVVFTLMDEDENVLSVTGFMQALGDGIVTLPNGNTVARIPAGSVFTSQPMDLFVPLNSPDEVTVRLDVAKIYHHQGQDDQVEMEGLATTHRVALVDTSYYGEVTGIVPESSTGDEDIVISGLAVDRETGIALADVPLNLVITVKGFERAHEVVTGPDGTFDFTFTPFEGECGVYTVRAVHPDLLDKPVHGQFVINRIGVTPAAINLEIPRNYKKEISIRVTAGEGTEATNLRLESDGALPQGVNVAPGAPIASFGTGQTASLPFTLWADNSAEEDVSFTLNVVSDESGTDPWGSVVVNGHFTQAYPVLYFTPDHVETGVARDDTVTETITFENKGLADMEDVALSVVKDDGSPAPEWVRLNADPEPGTLAVGEKKDISISFSPTAQVAEGIYAFYLRVTSTNYDTREVGLYASVTQSGVGSVLFKVSDIYTGTISAKNELIRGLSGAKIRIQNEEVLTIEKTLVTDNLGEALFEDLPAGRYKCRITANNHQEFIGRLWVRPGITATQDIFMEYNLVTVEWSVNEITIQDKYEILLSITYETDVPSAVVVTEPTSAALPKMAAGDVYNGEFTLTNYGLIRAEDLEFMLPESDQYFRFDLLKGMPDSLDAKQRITVPYRVTCIQSPDQEDAGGSGGGCESYIKCMKVSYGFCCANGKWTESFTNHCFTYTPTCFTNTPTIPVTTGGGGGVWNVGGPGGGGTVSSPVHMPEAVEGAKCFPEPEQKEAYCEPCARLKDTLQNTIENVGSAVNLVTREYTRDHVDLHVKVPGGTLQVKRWFYGNEWHWDQARNNLSFVYGSTSGAIETIKKGDVNYKRVSSATNVYTHETFRITPVATGYRWEDKRGNWKEYDENGRMTSYGNRSGVIGNLLYEPGMGGRLTGIADRNDTQMLWFEYNGEGLLSAVEDIENRRVEYTYTVGKLTTFKDVLLYDTHYEYNEDGRMKKVIDAAAHERFIEYDTYGNVKSVLDEEGEGVFFEFDYDEGKNEAYARIRWSTGTIKEVWHDKDGETKQVALNGRTIQKIAKDGRNLIITDESGNITKKYFDEWDNLTKVVYPDDSEVTYDYDLRFNKRTQEVNEKGVVTTYEYDDDGYLITKTEAQGTDDERITEYTYDDDGNQLSVKILGDTETAEALTVMEYDDKGSMTSITDPEEKVTLFTSYDVMGNVLTKRDAREKEWSYTYDDAGSLKTVTDPMTHMAEFFYDEVGNKIREKDAEQKETVYEYDGRGNLVKRTDAAGKSTLFEYNSSGKLLKQIDPEGKEVRYEYDQDGRLAKTIDGNGHEIVMEYEPAAGSGCQTCSGSSGSNQPSRIVYPTFEKAYKYDIRGRKTEERDVLSETDAYLTTFAYDDVGNLVLKVDKEDKETRYEYDALNRLKKVIDAELNETKYFYDDRDNLMRLEDAKNQITRFEYDRNNRLKKEIRPMGEETLYEYDGVGNLIKKTDPKGQVTEYAYDDAGRLTEIRYFNPVDLVNPVKIVSFTYDDVGNLKSYDDGSTSASYDYDDVYRKTTETVNYGPFTKTFHYWYYDNGVKKSFADPSGVTYEYTYDANNQLASVTIPGQGAITYTSYKWNRPETITLPGGANREYQYDPLMRVKQITSRDPAQNVLMQYGYAYDKMDNITGKETEHGPYAYGYDDLYRLETVDNPTLADEGFTYDPVGNRLTESGVTGEWTYNPNNELQTFDDVSFDYDDNGNMVRKIAGGVVTNYVYNIEDRLTEVWNGDVGTGSLIASYYYDPFGRRLWKEVGGTRTYFMYADEGLIGEYDGSGQEIKTYGYVPGSTWTTDPLFMKVGADHYFYQNDHLGTPQKMTSVNGSVVWSAKYISFGNADVDITSTITNNLRFPGQYFDQETGLHYNLNRYYDPNSGRYFKTDPIGLSGGINLMIYAFDNPLNKADPHGLIGASIDQNYYTLGVGLSSGNKRFHSITSNNNSIHQEIKNTLKSLINNFNMNMEKQLSRDIALGLDWRGDDMMDAIDLMNRRNKYSHLRYETRILTARTKNCIAKCFIKALIGVDDWFPLDGEIKTQIMYRLGDMALNKARKQGLKSIIIKVGSKALPIVGQLSTGISVIQSIYCSVNCFNCENGN